MTEAVPLELQVGWNSIGIPHTDGYSAESFCDEIISQGVTAVEIDRWYTGGWDGHICDMPFNDFNIERGKGYFVKTSSSGTVTPSELAGTVTPSELAGKRKALPLRPILPDDIPTYRMLMVQAVKEKAPCYPPLPTKMATGTPIWAMPAWQRVERPSATPQQVTW